MVFNMIPGYLLLHYALIGRGTTLKIVCKCVLTTTLLKP